MARYKLPDVAIPTDQICRDMIAGAIQYSEGRIRNYISGYENFWKLDRFGVEIMQAAIDHDQVEIIKILMESALEVMALAQTFPDTIGADPGQLHPKYTSSPYDYRVDDAVFQSGHTVATIADVDMMAVIQEHGLLVSGRIVLGELKEAWQPETEVNE